jgi:hypothetical protein
VFTARGGKEVTVTVRARASALVLFAVAVCAGAVLSPGTPSGAAPPDACAAALAYERTASADGVSRQAAYDAAVAGLTINQTCANPQQRLLNEAYLLSMRAAAAHDLNVGDWRRDLARADTLFTQCTTTPGLANTQAAKDCRTQLTYNRRYEAAASAASPAPTAAPASPGPATPAPKPPR